MVVLRGPASVRGSSFRELTKLTLRSRSFIGTEDPCTEQQLWYLYDRFRASPGDLATLARNPVEYEDLVLDQLATMEPDDLRSIYCCPAPVRQHIFIFTLWPSPTSRHEPETRIASQHVLELLWENLLRYRTPDMGYLYHQFRTSATTVADARWIFESRIHQLLRSRQIVRLFPIMQDRSRPGDVIYKGYPQENPMDLQLPGSDEDRLVEGGELRGNCCYRLPSANFSALLLICPPDGSAPDLLIFQITHNTKAHDVSEDSLRDIDNLGLSPDTLRYYVVVTPQRGVRSEIRFPKAYFGKRDRSKLPDNVLWVFNYAVPAGVLFPGFYA